MKTTKRLIKNLKDKNNVDIMQVIKTFIYGDSELEVYREGKVYKSNDFAIRYNERTSRFDTYRCIVAKSSLIWTMREWKREDILSSVYSVDDESITLSQTIPADAKNKLWFQQKNIIGDVVRVITKVKDRNGSYKTVLATTIVDEVYTTPELKETLTSKLNDMNSTDERMMIENINMNMANTSSGHLISKDSISGGVYNYLPSSKSIDVKYGTKLDYCIFL